MKSLSDFLEEITDITDDAIKKFVCKMELRKMKKEFCKHENVKTIPLGHFQYFQYDFLNRNFKTNMSDSGEFKLCSIMYWDDANQWFLADNTCDWCRKEINISRLNGDEMAEVISILKRELFNN